MKKTIKRQKVDENDLKGQVPVLAKNLAASATWFMVESRKGLWIPLQLGKVTEAKPVSASCYILPPAHPDLKKSLQEEDKKSEQS